MPRKRRRSSGIIRRGGGFVGVHSATDTEYDWPFYGALVGAYFAGHPDIQNATIQIEDAAHPVDGVAAARVDAPRRVVQLPAESPRHASTCSRRSTSALTPAARWRRTIRLCGRTPTRAGGRSTPRSGTRRKASRRRPSSITSGGPFSGRLVRYDFAECHLKTNRSSSAAPISRS